MDFNQTQTQNIDTLWHRDECFTFWGQKVKVRGHSRITGAYLGPLAPTPPLDFFCTNICLKILMLNFKYF